MIDSFMFTPLLISRAVNVVEKSKEKLSYKIPPQRVKKIENQEKKYTTHFLTIVVQRESITLKVHSK
jgi:hypothetical protein